MFEGYSDLLVAFMRYGGFLGMILMLVVGAVYLKASLDDLKAETWRTYRRRMRQQLYWGLAKLFFCFWVFSGLFLVSFQ